MEFPEDLRYSKEHEWARVDRESVIIGISDHAQEQLGDIVFIELPQEGDNVAKDDAFGVVESVKAVSDIYAPISGEVIEVNEILIDSPELINEDPYGEGWMVKIKCSDVSELDSLMSASEYTEYLKEET